MAAVTAVILYRLLRQASGPDSPGVPVEPVESPRTESGPDRSLAPSSPTRADLYREAQRLEIPGRSSMNKAGLARAIEAAQRAGGATA